MRAFRLTAFSTQVPLSFHRLLHFMPNFILVDSLQQYVAGNGTVAGGYQTGGWSPSSATAATINATGSRWGTKAFRLDTANVTKQFSVSTVQGCANLAFLTTSITIAPTVALMSILSTGVAQFSICANASGGLELRRGSGSGTLLAQSVTGKIATSTFYFLEVMWECDAAVGKVKVYLNGELIFDLTGINNRGATTTDCNQIQLLAGGSHQRYFCDIYVTDAFVRVGERKFETVTVTADTATAAWLANAGSAWDAVNDSTPDNDTTYIYASIVGNRSMFQLADLSENPVTIDLVKFNIIAAKDDAATRGLKIVASDGTNEYLSPEVFMNTTYGAFSFYSATAPDGGGWTKAKVDAVTAGVEVTT